MENKTHHEIAMELSDGLFAWHIFGVMIAAHNMGNITPDLEAEALDYIQDRFPQKTLDPTTSS